MENCKVLPHTTTRDGETDTAHNAHRTGNYE